MKKLKKYFQRQSSTGHQPPKTQDQTKTKEIHMQTQVAAPNPLGPGTGFRLPAP
jgi:hypothetical protein